METTMSSGWRLLLRRLLIFWVFALFPAVVGLMALVHIERVEVDKEIRAGRIWQERQLVRLRRIGEEVQTVAQLLKRTFAKMQGVGPSRRRVLLRRLQRRFPGTFDWYVLGSQGKVVPQLSSAGRPGKATSMVFETLCGMAEGRGLPDALPENRKPSWNISSSGSIKPRGRRIRKTMFPSSV